VKYIIDRGYKQTRTEELSNAYSRIEKAVLFGECASVGAKALDDIEFAPMGAVDRSYRCAPRLNAPQISI